MSVGRGPETAPVPASSAAPLPNVAAVRSAYAAAGVDVAAGERAVELIRQRLGRQHGLVELPTAGGFGSAVAMPGGYREPVMVTATDGVGTKTALARSLQRFDTIGHDLVAMCADDVVCSGARPLLFLDYVVVGRVDPANVAEIVGGIAAGCDLAGCSLVGGETAEHPALMEPDEFDLAGFCVGLVERERLLDGTSVRAGDALVGIASSGLHANGYSLVRALIERFQLQLSSPYLECIQISLGDDGAHHVQRDEPDLVLATLGEVLLTPTRIYASDVLALRERLDEMGTPLHALAHVTGGGLARNVPRVLPQELGARIETGAWPVPSICTLLARLAGMDGAEMRATLNGGIGMVAVVSQAALDEALSMLEGRGLRAWRIGEVVPVEVGHGARYHEVAS